MLVLELIEMGLTNEQIATFFLICCFIIELILISIIIILPILEKYCPNLYKKIMKE